ncbi:MG2 domain-containing protein [Helicobacter sp. MIT 21-1697]|uniref:alpha-2-macroglobulin family protein n=1 Tax=Helicobacter sp. MIT 21-1697 TaxID=2993733 RepID=UPI00224B4B8B|nr:Ig-like domain-containing alpha-2-macroglobulin family protein [Helicobacter sp. MIT 21-1697]MCX2717942.1 MG2 domain-containing protein [Helicobacter sp. MIT 21-1697]
MRYLQHIWKFFVFFNFICTLTFFTACSDNKFVESYTQNISTTPEILITFNQPIASDNAENIGILYNLTEQDKFVTLNGKSVVGQYSFKSPYELLIIPNGILEPNTDYTLNVKLAKLAQSLLEDTINLELRTDTTKIETSKLLPHYIDDKNFFISAQIVLSQEIKALGNTAGISSVDSKELRSIFALKDDTGKEIDFTLAPQANKDFVITSQNLTFDDKEKSYELTLYAKALGLEKDEILRYVRESEGLEVVDIQAILDETPHIQVHFSQNLADNANLEDFVSINPQVKAKIIKQGNIMRINAPFNPSTSYKVHIKEGIMAIDRSRLEKPKDADIVFNQIPPSLAFSQQGVFLPSNAEKKVAFKSINVKKVNLKVSKIYPNNTTAYLYKQNLIGETKYNNASNSYDEDYYDDEYSGGSGIYADFERLGDVVFEQSFDIALQKNQWIQTQLDFSALKEQEGIFIIELSFDKNGVDYDFPEGTSQWRKEQFFNQQGKIMKHLIFSNIALLAQQIDNKLEVFALDIASNKPLPQVKINAISPKNQTIATSTTNEQGLAHFESAQKIMYLSATKGEDTTILRLKAPLSLEGFDVEGLQSHQNTFAYIYTDRGVYRPGDTAHINIIARTDSKPITHPIQISLTSPQGKVVLEDFSLKEQLFGLFAYDFKIDKNADTGIWRLKTKVGGSEFWHNISVESVVPNRIKVEVASPEHMNLTQLKKNDNTLFFDIHSHYLFGAPASNLKYENKIYIQGINFYAPAYSSYTFMHPSSLHYSFNDTSEGQLNEKGHTQSSFNIKNTEDIGKNLRAFITTKVFENGGRFVSARKNIDIALYDSFVGIKSPPRYVSADSEIQIPIIVLSSDTQKPLAHHNLSFRIYQNSYSWWWDYDNYNEFAHSIKRDKNTKLLKSGTLISKSEPVMLTFKPIQTGEIFIEVEDESNHSKSAIFLYASEAGEPIQAPKNTQLKVQSDKEQYLVGEEATINFESTPDAQALITIVNQEKVLDRFWIHTKEAQSSFKIPLKKSYAPNIYVAINLLQNYHKLDNDRSQRLYGVLPLMVEDKDSKLTLEIDAPQSIRPNTDFEVKLSNKEGKKVAYTLAIVDEGLLDLTDFASPNPWKYFYQKIALALSAFDNYNLIIGKDIGHIHQILKVGGDELTAGANRKDLHQAQRFKPVTFYSPPIMSDESGKAQFNYTMPAYMGSVRIMAVAVNDKAYGSASKDMKVSAPVVMLPTLPRSLKIGDSFTLAIEVFPTQDNVGKATLALASGEKIKLETNNITLTFKDKKSQTIHIKAQVDKESIGQDFIDIALKSGDFSMQERTEIDILPNNPYITLNKKFTLQSKDSLTLENPKEYVRDSQMGYVLVSNKPIMSIDHRLKWLIRYPYGCIEQTTSSVLPQLFLTTLSKANFIDKPTIVKNINAGIARIATFQTSNGGFAYWQGGSASDSWGSAYAGHFLLLAKAQGYYVPESILKAWIHYETHYVKNTTDVPTTIYPLYLLSLAGSPQIGLLNNIYEHHFKKLDVGDKWLLAAAYKLAGLEEVAHKITENLPTKSTTRDNSYYRFSYGSPLRDDAMILKAYTDIYKTPHKELLTYIQQQLEGDEWFSTQTLGYSLLAIAATLPPQGVDSQNSFSVTFDGKSFEGKDTLKIPFDTTKGKITSQSAFPLYISQVWDGILLQKDIKPSAKKIALERSFVDEKGNEINVDSLPSGSTFYLKLTLTNADKSVSVDNVAISQNLPSGWEIENTRLNDDKLPDFVRNDNITYTDIRDDKIMWFLDYYGKSRTLFVKINTITPGAYLLPPANAEAMYDNSFLANTESRAVVVTPP